jgi:hypothetical protein
MSFADSRKNPRDQRGNSTGGQPSRERRAVVGVAIAPLALEAAAFVLSASSSLAYPNRADVLAGKEHLLHGECHHHFQFVRHVALEERRCHCRCLMALEVAR